MRAERKQMPLLSSKRAIKVWKRHRPLSIPMIPGQVMEQIILEKFQPILRIRC